jgi:hypothetical protein
MVAASLGCILFTVEAMGTVHTYPSSDVPKDIPNLATIVSSLTVPDSGTILDINVELTIDHTYDDDLDVYLIHDGVTVKLFTDVGGSGNNFENTFLDDEAGTPITEGSAPFSGSYRPEGSLADFDDLNMQGQWQLRISDDATSDTGELLSWQLVIHTCPPPPCPMDPDPADGAENVPVNTCLSWTGRRGTCVVIPNANTSVEGNRNNHYPFDLTGPASMRYQQIYASTEFPQSGVITQVRFRPDEPFGEPFSDALVDVDIFLGYAATSVLTPSESFADNIGPGYVMVYDGTLTLSSNNVGGPPRNFDIVVNVDDVFHYDPANGPLLLDIKVHNSPSSTVFDAVGGGAQSVTTRIRSESTGSVNDATGVVNFSGPESDPYGLVTMFCFDGATPPMSIDNTATYVRAIDTETHEVDPETGETVATLSPLVHHQNVREKGSLWRQSYSDDELDEGGNLRSVVGAANAESIQAMSAANVINSFACPDSHPGGLAWKDGYLFHVDYETETVYQINPSNGAVLSTIGPFSNLYGLTWDGAHFWSTDSVADTIFKFNTSGTLIKTLSAPGTAPCGITWDGSSLWVSDWTADMIYQVDPSNGTVQSSFPAPDMRIGGMAFDGTDLWANGRDSAMTYRISRTSGTVLESIPTPPSAGTNNGQGCTFDGRYLWIANWDTQKIYQVDVGLAGRQCPITWDVYLGTDPNTLELIASNLSVPTYCPCGQPCGLHTWTQYYWQVIAKNSDGQTAGPIWSFKTECPVDLNHDTFVDIRDLDIFLEKWLDAICPITQP